MFARSEDGPSGSSHWTPSIVRVPFKVSGTASEHGVLRSGQAWGTPRLVETLKIVILSEAKDLCTPRQLHRSFAAKNAAQDDKVCGGQF